MAERKYASMRGANACQELALHITDSRIGEKSKKVLMCTRQDTALIEMDLWKTMKCAILRTAPLAVADDWGCTLLAAFIRAACLRHSSFNVVQRW